MTNAEGQRLAEWAEHEMAIRPNSPTALRGAEAATHGRETLDRAVARDTPHGQAEPSPGVAESLDRARRGIAGTGESE